MKREKIYKWLYQKNGYYRQAYQLINAYLRIPFYLHNPNKINKIIHEHFNW